MFSLTLQELETTWIGICDVWCTLYRLEQTAARRARTRLESSASDRMQKAA